MAIDLQRLKARVFAPIEHSYSSRDTALYALCVGYGVNPMDAAALRFVDEPTRHAPPSMAAVLAWPGQWMREPDSGIDWVKVVHGEQRVRLHHPLPAAAKIMGRARVSSVIDKGPGKGAIVTTERSLTDMATGLTLATVEQVNFCRGDGGFLRPGEASDPALPALSAAPDRAPDRTVDIPTRTETALLYRLCGDMNPLHADPQVALAAGFERPILHGLATYGIAGRAVLKSVCDDDATRLRTLGARFSAPVYPGETLRTDIWLDGGRALFRVTAIERSLAVLTHGVAVLSL